MEPSKTPKKASAAAGGGKGLEDCHTRAAMESYLRRVYEVKRQAAMENCKDKGSALKEARHKAHAEALREMQEALTRVHKAREKKPAQERQKDWKELNDWMEDMIKVVKSALRFGRRATENCNTCDATGTHEGTACMRCRCEYCKAQWHECKCYVAKEDD